MSEIFEQLSFLEQPESVPAEADNTTEGSNILGKFASVEELAKAYDNLQAEFTRKCQQLKTPAGDGREFKTPAADAAPPLQKGEWLLTAEMSKQGNASVADYEEPVLKTPAADAAPPLQKGESLLPVQKGEWLLPDGECLPCEDIRPSLCENLAPSLREAVIREYLTSVASKQTAPAVITAGQDFAFGVMPERKSLRDIESVAENYFRNKEKI